MHPLAIFLPLCMFTKIFFNGASLNYIALTHHAKHFLLILFHVRVLFANIFLFLIYSEKKQATDTRPGEGEGGSEEEGNEQKFPLRTCQTPQVHRRHALLLLLLFPSTPHVVRTSLPLSPRYHHRGLGLAPPLPS